MSYADDFEDVGGYLADQDFYAEECENYDGNCKKCPYEHHCQSSDYNKAKLERWR